MYNAKAKTEDIRLMIVQIAAARAADYARLGSYISERQAEEIVHQASSIAVSISWQIEKLGYYNVPE